MNPRGYWSEGEGKGLLQKVMESGETEEAFKVAAKLSHTSLPNVKLALKKNRHKLKPLKESIEVAHTAPTSNNAVPLIELKVTVLGKELAYSQFLELFNQMAILRDAMKRPT